MHPHLGGGGGCGSILAQLSYYFTLVREILRGNGLVCTDHGSVGSCVYAWWMKRCSRCREEKLAAEFPANKSNPDGLLNWCKECKNAHRRARSMEAKRIERQAWRAANREKYLAQKALQKAVKRGTVVRPEVCSGCGAGDVWIHGHHPDYSKRFEVVWLCPACHGKEHAGWTWPVAA